MASSFPGTAFAGNQKSTYTDGGTDAQFWLEADSDNIDDEIIAIQNTLHTSGNVRRFYNDTGSALAAGDLVYVSNYDTGNSLPEVALADADTFGTAAGYVVIVAANNAAVGVMAKAAKVGSLDTSTFTTGDELYLSTTAGGWSNTAPASGKVCQYVGRATKIDASSGEIEFDISRQVVPDDTTIEHATTTETLQVKSNSLSGTQVANIADLGHGIPFVIRVSAAAVATTSVYTANAPFKFRVLDAWSVAKTANAGTWKVTDGTNDIIPAVTSAASDTDIDRAAQIDDAYHEIAASGSLAVVTTGASATYEIYITCMRVA